MANKGESKCLKVNKVGFVHRFEKNKNFVLKPHSGKHNAKTTVSVGYVLRDMLGIADNKREIIYLINNRELYVDGVPVKSKNLPVGIFDIISLPKLKKNYKMHLLRNGLLSLVEINDDETSTKLCRIISKKLIKDNKIQLITNDGRILVTDNKAYKTKATIKLDLEENSIKEYYPLERKHKAFIIGGSHVGVTAEILNITPSTMNKQALVKLKNKDEGEFETTQKNVFVIE